MSGTTSSNNPMSLTGAAPGGGGSGGTSVGGSTSGVTLPTLPPQYSTGNLGFFTRQTEYVPTGVTVGPDGALYVSGLTGIPYPDGYSSIYRIANPTATTGYNGTTPSGVPQVYASGFSQVQSLSFDAQGNLYVLEYVNSNAVYDPTQALASLPPSQLIKVAPDGTRTTISGPELRLGNYVLADKTTGDVYVAINGSGPATSTAPGTGEVLRYHTDPTTGAVTNSVVASGLNNPRGMAFGPDGKLYVLEQGTGTPSGAPGADTAPVIPFIPGLVSERGGYTGSITSVDVKGDGSQARVYTGLPSFREFNPTTGQDRVISIGPNALTITPDGTVYIASGGGLAPETAAAAGPIADGLQGVLKLTGLFGPDPSQATYTPAFTALTYAAQNGPDGATTLFNTESNLYDITQGADGKIYTVDAARNDVYGLTNGGSTVDSVTVLQKLPPVLTPPQYAAVLAGGGNPSAEYAAEIASTTYKNANNLPDVPGNLPDASSAAGLPPGGTPPTMTATLVSGTTGSTTPTSSGGTASSTPPHGEDTTGSGVTGATSTSTSGPPTGTPGVPGGPPPGPFPGPTDPTSPPVLPGNIYSNSFNPFFGNFAPAASDPLALSNGQGGTFTASHLYNFGDRLADAGNAAALAKSLGQTTDLSTAPFSPTGNFSDGPKWTTDLAQMLGLTQPGQDTNFAYENATARPLTNPFDPNQAQAPLTNFSGQIQQFEQAGQTFSANDVVTVTFGGNDITLPSNLPVDVGISLSVDSILGGMQQLADLGAKHFLVSNLPDITLAPIFSDPAFQAATGSTPATLQPLVDQFNAKLTAGVAQFGANTGLDVKEFDLHTLFNGIAANPSNYGFANVAQPVLAAPPGATPAPVYNPAIVGQDPAVQHATLFTDPFFDPTALGQALIAQTARSTLTA